MTEVAARLVGQAVPQGPAHHDACHPEKQEVSHILARPRARAGAAAKRRVPQTPAAQQHEQAKGREIAQAIPVNGQRADLQRDGIAGGVNQHGGRYCARQAPGVRRTAGPAPGQATATTPTVASSTLAMRLPCGDSPRTVTEKSAGIRSYGSTYCTARSGAPIMTTALG